MYFLAASLSDCACVHGHTETLHTPEKASHNKHAGNSCKLPLQHYNNRLLLSAQR